MVAALHPAAAEPTGAFKLGKPQRVRVTHTTRVRVAAGTTGLHLWHARPLPRTWPGLPAPLDVGAVDFAPAGAKEVPTRTEGGRAWKWELEAPAPGELTFVSTFELTSVDRELRTAGLKVSWAELATHATEVTPGLAALPEPNAKVRDVVDRVRKKSDDVLDALVALSRAVVETVPYRPGVPYGSDDLTAICRGGGGHCGHRATFFLSMCRAAGIPARRVLGFALLNQPPGPGADDGNRHVWAEVSLPRLGWVEIDPGAHGSPFALGRAYVACPPDFQSRFVDTAPPGGPGAALLSDTLKAEPLR